MKVETIKVRLPDSGGPVADQPAFTPALTSAEAERLLVTWHTSQHAEGLESRVLGRLQAHPALGTAPASHLAAAWSRIGAMAPLAASLFCLFTGGFLVAREAGSRAQPLSLLEPQSSLIEQRSPAQVSPLALADPLAAGGGATVVTAVPSLATASARRKPVGLIPAGRRRGRASTNGASHSR